jgi:hypothetical protein
MPRVGGSVMAAQAYQRFCSFPYREHPSGLLWRRRFHLVAGLSPLGERRARASTPSPAALNRAWITDVTLDEDDTHQAVGIARSTGMMHITAACRGTGSRDHWP